MTSESSDMSQCFQAPEDPSHHEQLTKAASTSSLYALTSIAYRIPMMATVCKSVRSVSKSRRASFSSSAFDETLFNSSSASPRSSRPSTPQNQTLSTKVLDSCTESSFPPIPSASAFKGGVDWDTAKTGIGIWFDAVRRIEAMDARKARQMQIDAIKYMHNALPTDLSDSDFSILELSLMGDRNPPGRSVGTCVQEMHAVQGGQAGNNIVRSTTARLVCWIVSFVMFAIPIFMSLLNKALRYEREHHITKRAIENGADIAKAASAAGVDMGEKMFKFKDTEVGAYCAAGFAWTLQSVLEGVNDGVQTSRSGCRFVTSKASRGSYVS